MTLPCSHPARDGAGEPQRGEQVDREDALPGLVGHVEDVQSFFQSGVERVVDERVDAAEGRRSACAAIASPSRDVGGGDLDPAVRRLLRGSARRPRPAAPRRARPSARRRRRARTNAAIAAPMFLLAPGDERHLAVEPEAVRADARSSSMHDRPCGHVEVLSGDRDVGAEEAHGRDDVARAWRSGPAARRRGTPPRRPAPAPRARRRAARPRPGRARRGSRARRGAGVPGERAHEPDQRGLGRRVRRAAGQRALAGHRADHDDAPAPARDHPRQERAAGQEDAGEVRAGSSRPSPRARSPTTAPSGRGCRRPARARRACRTARRRRPARRDRRRRRRARRRRSPPPRRRAARRRGRSARPARRRRRRRARSPARARATRR